PTDRRGLAGPQSAPCRKGRPRQGEGSMAARRRKATGRTSRRRLLATLSAAGLLGAAGLPLSSTRAQERAPGEPGPKLTRRLPATGEELPVIGMGSWITFNVGEDAALRAQRTEVLRTFFAR